jgi:hypothetical protein
MIYSMSIVHTRKPAEKRGRGRPRTHWVGIHLTILPPQAEAIDEWIKKHGEPEISRQEAIRRLVDHGLEATSAGPVSAVKRATRIENQKSRQRRS